MTELVNSRFARQRAASIRQGMRDYLKTLALIKEAWDQRDWEALGYADWHSYVDGEFGAERLGLTPEHRRKAVEELRLAGMSQRAIAAAVGVDQATVIRDLRRGDASASPDEITGADGKRYAATRPTDSPAGRADAGGADQPGAGHLSATGEEPTPGLAAVPQHTESEVPAGQPPAGAGDPLPAHIAAHVEQRLAQLAEDRANREALYAPREVVDAVNAATHFVPAMVAIQSACEDLLHRVREFDPERAVVDLPDDLRDRLAVARAAHQYLTRVVDALDRIGVPA